MASKALIKYYALQIKKGLMRIVDIPEDLQNEVTKKLSDIPDVKVDEETGIKYLEGHELIKK